VQQRHWFSSKIEEFKRFETVERGLVETTVVQRGNDVSRFLLWVGPRKSLKQITADDVSRYLQSEEIGSWKRTSIGLYLTSLRAFFRFAESRGWCQPQLGEMIDSPRLYRHERLPRGPRWKDVQRLLGASRRNTPTAVRNYVLLSFFAIYGFRSSEVRRLRLDDIDWELETICLNAERYSSHASTLTVPLLLVVSTKWSRRTKSASD
jgi:site-specific recombinase XerD